MKISIVVPVHNEEGNLEHLYTELSATAKNHSLDLEMIFVDDGSKDRSQSILKSLAAQDKRVKLVCFRRNFGQTAAMSAGFYYATGDITIPMDGDLQNDPNDIPKFLTKVREGFDVVSGWRKDRQDRAFSRKLPSWLANRLISWLSGLYLHDYGCTMKAYRTDIVKNVKLYGEMHRFIPIYAKWEGANITEIPVNHRARTAGTSKYGINRTFKVVLDLLVIKFLEKYYNKPIYVFGGFAIISGFLSLLSFLLMLYFKYFGDKTFIQTPLPALVVTFAMIGILSFMIGLVAEMVTRTYFESQNRQPFQVKFLANIDDRGNS